MTFRSASLLFVLLAPGGVAWAQQAPDNPRLRWEFFYQKRAFPFQRIPAGALERGRIQAAALRSALRAAPPPIGGTQWSSIGPDGFPVSIRSTGRISAIAVHPTDPNTIYIGGAQGGVWKTTNAGASWVPLTDRECSLAMGALAIDPVNPQIVYAGTGEQHFSGDSYYGCGVLRSPDGGATWTRLGASIFQTATGGARISRVLIDPRGAGTPATTRLFVASDFGLYRSLDGGGTLTPVRTGIVTDLVMNPTTPDVLYAAVRDVGIFKSVDGGVTWAPRNTGFASAMRRINLAISPSSPAVLYASAEAATGGTLAGIWRSGDGADTWTQVGSSLPSCGSQCWYDQVLAVAPNGPNTVYFGGIQLFKSIDAGASFAGITDGIHVDQHAITFHPTDPLTVYVGNDGGVFRSGDGGGSWASLNTNLALTQFYEGVTLHPWDPAAVLAGTQDNGTLAYAGVPTWDPVLGGDGGYTAFDRENPVTRYAETQWTAGSGFSGPRRSDGAGFALKTNGINTSDRGLFIPPLVMDPTNTRRLYFGTFRVYRTTDRADSWTAISGDLTNGGAISAIAPAAGDPAVIYVGTSDGLVHTTDDGGQTWIPRTLPLAGPRFVQDIAVDPRDPRTAYVVVSGFLTPHVFRTTDLGASFQNVSGSLPDVPVNAVVADPTSRAVVLIGTDLGVFASSDSGGSWTPVMDGLPNVAVFDLAYNASTGVLVAATHGRGMFALQLVRPLTLAVVPGTRRDTAVAGDTDPRADSAMVVLTGAGAGTSGWSAGHGAASWLSLSSAGGTGSGAVRWTRNPAGLAPGMYVDTITVTAAGAVDSPWLLIDSLLVRSVLSVAFTPASRRDSVPVGSTTLLPDSAMLSIAGIGGDTTSWIVTEFAPWVTLATGSGRGSGMVRWTRNPTGLTPGTHVTPIRAELSSGDVAILLDSLLILPPPLALPPARIGLGISGSDGPVPDSAAVELRGTGQATATWTATHQGSPWLTFSTGSGTGSGTMRWLLDASALTPRVYLDTITVATSRGDSARMEATFVVTAPTLAASCAVGDLIGTPCLNDTQRRFLDLTGNQDGEFNLGDFLALLARTGRAVTAERRR